MDGRRAADGGAVDIATDAEWRFAGLGDLDGDGRDDVLLRHGNGSWRYYPLNGPTVGAGAGAANLTRNLDYGVAGVGDFDGDGNDDVLLRHAGGRWYYYPMDGRRFRSNGRGTANLTRNLDWSNPAIGDFNGDGNDDVLLRRSDGRWYHYAMNGRTFIRGQQGSANLTRNLDWSLAGVGDFDGDGKDDVLMRHADGRWYYYPMNGRRFRSNGRGTANLTRNVDWSVAGVGDFNADGRDDVLLRHADGRWHHYAMNGRRFIAGTQGAADLPRDLAWRLGADAPAVLPTTGFAGSGFTHFDDVMTSFMNARSIPAGALAITRFGVRHYERGFGWLDKEQTRATPPDALFRIASVTKPITQAAIDMLIREGRLDRDAPVFCLSQPPCLVDVAPFGEADPRTQDITVRHLLDHRAGWDRDISGDPMFDAIRIAETLGVPSPPGKRNVVRYVLGRPLDFAPGARFAYSNFGYLVLGLIVEEVSGVPFTRFVQERVLAPIGVAATEVELGRSLPPQRNPREPWYSDPYRGRSVFDPSVVVPFPDGAFHVEAFEAHGGLIASTAALAGFVDRYIGDGEWRFYGSMPGTFSFVWQRTDGVAVVALFNQRTDESGLDYYQIQDVLGKAIAVIRW